jgi:hypothetical protein
MATFSMNQEQYKNVLDLPAPKRYGYFIKRVADWQKAWTLNGQLGIVSGEDDNGTIHIPMWAHPMFAEMCAVDLWSEARVVSLGISELTDNLLPQLQADMQMVSVMPISGTRGISVNPLRLKHDLEIELERIE